MTTDKPLKYVWVVEKKPHGTYGCTVRRYVFVKENKVSISVLEHGANKVIYHHASMTFLYDPRLVRTAITKHLLDQLTRLKMDITKLERMIDNPEDVVIEIDHKPYEKVENIQLD